MSHFTVLVVGDNIDEQLAPFNEQPEEGSPYIEFDDRTEEFLDEYENRKIEGLRLADGSVRFKWDKEFIKKTSDPFKQEYKYPEGSRIEEIPVKEFYSSYEEYLKDFHGAQEQDGRYGWFRNPNAKWDWYQVGGRWNGFFKLKPLITEEVGAYPDREVGAPGVFGNVREDYTGRADQAYKHEVDVEAMRNETEEEARKAHQMVLYFYNGKIPPFTHWQDFIKKVEDKTLSIEEARELYWNQEALQRKKNVREINESEELGLSDEDGTFLVFCKLEDFDCSEDEYAQAARNRAISTYAILKDGEWIERGEMGWFGMASNEMEQEDWNDKFTRIFDSLPDSALLTVVDCHI